MNKFLYAVSVIAFALWGCFVFLQALETSLVASSLESKCISDYISTGFERSEIGNANGTCWIKE